MTRTYKKFNIPISPSIESCLDCRVSLLPPANRLGDGKAGSGKLGRIVTAATAALTLQSWCQLGLLVSLKMQQSLPSALH
jgi:hypothetical protein